MKTKKSNHPSFATNKHLPAIFSAAVIACLSHTSPALQAQTYTITDLGVLAGKTQSTPTAINNQGQATGTSSAGDPSSDAAFRYNPTSKVPMENLAERFFANVSRGFGINKSGDVVGDSALGKSESVRHATLFKGGSLADLGTLKKAGDFSRANSINDAGQVVGFCGPTLDSNESRAFIWSPSTGMTDIGTLGGAYAGANAINDAGFVTGTSQISSKPGAPTHAFIYRPLSSTTSPTAKMLDLGTLGGHSSYGTSINASNHVVGYSTTNNLDDRFHAFLHDGRKMIDLGSLGGASSDIDLSFALGVNANDQVVGYSYLPSGESPRATNAPFGPWPVAFLYRNGKMLNLNDLIGDAAKNYRLDSAAAINDEGQIVAVAFVKSDDAFHAVVLTPTETAKKVR